MVFFVIRDFRRSWILFVSAGLAALYTWLKLNIDDWPDYLDDGISTFISGSSAVLAFVLSFQLGHALSMHSGGVSAFNGICGDLLAFALHLVALSADDPEIKDSKRFIQAKKNIRDLLLSAPGMFKWNMRPEGVNIDLVQVKDDGGGNSVKLYERNEKMYCLLKRYMSIGPIEALMLALGNEIHTIRESGALDGAQETVLMAKWEHIYSNYGAITGAATPPPMLDWFLYITLAIYTILMPYEFANLNYHGTYLAFFTSYFYLGLWIASRGVGDPFQSTDDFETVTGAASGIQQAIEEMFKREASLSLDDDACSVSPNAVIEIEKDVSVNGARKNINKNQLRNQLEKNSTGANYVSTRSDNKLQEKGRDLHW